MADNDKLKIVYDALINKNYELGDYNTFYTDIQDETYRKNVYDAISEHYDVGDYNAFNTKIMGAPTATGISAQQPSGQTQQSVTTSQPPLPPAGAGVWQPPYQPGLKEQVQQQQTVVPPLRPQEQLPEMPSSPWSEQELRKRKDLTAYNLEAQEDAQIRRENDIPSTPAGSAEAIFTKYQDMFSLTGRGKQLTEELAGIERGVFEKYLNEYKSTDEYKALVGKRYASREEADREMNEKFMNRYGTVIEEEMRPYMETYDKELNERYGGQISREMVQLRKQELDPQIDEMTGSVKDQARLLDDVISKRKREIIAKYRGKPGHEPMEEILGRWQFPDDLATEQEWREFRSTDRDKIRDRALLREAEDWIGETRDLVDAAINHSGFRKGVANTAGDPDTWSFGFGDLIRSRKLRETLEKADRGEELSEAEKTYLKVAVMNMAANAYYRSDLSGWYKAGETTGASLPFMLEFAVNPISASGSAVAKSLLKYGMKKFGKAAMKKGVAKATARFLGDAAAAAGMTLTTGLPGVVADTERRLAENYEYDIDENGEPVVRKTGNVGVGEALGKSVASGTIGRQSEMIFNAFGGLGGKVSGAIEKYMPGGVKRFMSEIKNSGMGRVYRNITGNPVLREAMRRTQFHGYSEEVAEEIYDNLANIPLGDMTLEEATDLDTNIDILLGLAPTSLAFGMVGLGGMVRDRRRINGNLEQIRQTMDDQTRRTFDEWMKSLEDKSHDELRDAVKKVIMDKNLTPELKKEMLHAGYLIAQGKAAQDIRDGQTETERAVDDAYEEGMNTSPQEQHNVGADAESAMQALFDANEALGNIVQEMSRSDATVADLEEELTRRGATKEDALLARNAFLANARMAGVIDAAQEEADAAVDAYAKQLLPACVESEDGSRTVTTAMMNVNGQPSQVYVMDDGSASGAGMAIIMDETGKKTAVDPKSLSDLNRRTYDEMVEEYRQQMRGHAQQITEWALNHNAKTRVPETGMVFTSADNTFLMITGQVGDSWQVFPARLDPKTGAYVPVTDTQGTTMSTDEVLKAQDGYYNAVEANEKGQLPQAESPQGAGEVPQQAAEETPVQEAQVQSASERIPKDEQGNLVYEQADPDTAWDVIVEQTDGDEAMAQTVADAMVADKEAELKRIGKVKMKGRLSVAEKIEVEKKRRAVIQQAEAELDHWRKIAGTANRRKQAAEAERRRVAEEATARQKAEEERLRAEREEAERIEREALNGVPDMVDDTPQDARARGYRRVSGHKVDRQEPVQALQGKEVAVKFSDDIIPNGRVAVIDAGQLQPSHIQGVRNPLHFIDEAQPKERNDEASVLSAQRMAGNIRPEEITSSVTAYTGAPTVNMRGEVIQGNNRSSALRQMWESQPEQSARYKQYLVDHAQEFGLNAEDIAGMQRPVLVNMLDVSDAEAVTLGQYVAQDTESGGTERIRPRNVLQKMGGDIRSFANLLLKSADSDISFSGLVDSNGLEVLKWMNRKGYITPTQYKSAFDSKGNLTPEAKNDLRNIMYQDIFKGGSTRLEEMFNAMPAKAQKAILATAFRDHESPASERMIDEIQNSIVAYHLLSQDEAFAGAKNFKEARMAAENWKRQYQMDDVTGESFLPADNFSNFALLLATMYKGESQGTMQEKFNGMYDLIQGTREGSLFEQPDNTPRTLAQAIREILNIDYNGKIRSNVLAGNDTAGERRGHGSGRDVGTGERIEGRDGSAVGSGRTGGDSGRIGANSEDRGNKEKENDETEVIGRSMTTDEAQDFIADMELNAEIAPEIELTIENWDGLFGEDGIVLTPIGDVKMGENQFAKLMRQGRNGKLGMIKPTLEHPHAIIEDVSEAKEGDTAERASSFVFIRSFKKADDSRYYYFTSVTVSKDGKEVVVSNQEKRRNAIANLLTKGKLVWKHADDVSDASDVAQGLYSSQGNASDLATEGTDAPQTKYVQKETVVPYDGGAQTEHYPADVSVAASPENMQGNNKEADFQTAAFQPHEAASSESKNNTLPSEKQANGAENSENTGIGEKIAEAEADVNTNPTDKQKEAGNYKKGHVQIGTFDITIENPKGSVRSGVDAGGKKWETTMQNTYGYMRGTEGVDGDHIDVFLSDDMDGWNGRRVFVVDQYNEDGSFDEHKVMLGFNDADEAESAYLSNYEKDWADKRKIAVSSINLEDFEKWIDSSHRKTKPFAEYKNVKAASDEQQNDEKVTEKASPHLSPKRLYDAYESGDADVIADTERTMRDFVEQGDRKQTAVTYFYSKDITRRVEDETTRKVHEFIAKTCRETLVKAGIPKQAFMSAKVRRDLARQAEDPAVLEIMSADPDIEVLRTVIRNPNTSEATLRNFMEAYSNNGLDYEAQQALEQRKTRGDTENGLLFREMEDTSDRSLVAVHNLSAERLSQALELGGFPMPSIAVTKADVGHTNFGDISLVFGKESINPTDRRNKVYGEDAWTPMFPQVGYKLNDEKTSGIYRRANKAGSLPLFRPVDFHPDNYERQINGLDSESLVNHFKDDYGAKQLYLSETGNAVKEFEQHEVEKYLPDQVALNEKVLKEIGLERLKSGRDDALENDVKQLIGEHYNVDFDTMKPFRVKVRIDNTIRHAIDYAENGNRKTESDIEATKKKIDERIDPKKFEAWLKDLFDGVVEKKGIRNDRDPFTPSGNRRKWEDLYDKITLDNVIKAMRKQSERGGQGLFGGSIFGAAQEEYKSIDEIREAARERIRTMNEADYEAQRNAITDRLSAIKIPGVGNGFSDAMDMAQNIQDAVARSHTPKGIHKYLKEFYPKVTMEIANEIANIVKDIQRMSARYFEAKPYRAVGFDEVRLAVVPSDTDANLVAELERRGIPVRIYEKGNEAERRQIVEEATNELNLRFRVDGDALTEEERSIVDRAKADGTYMKAPNGKPTNLTEKQWMQVRTDAFKEWFGDWEKAARVEKLRHSEPVEITGDEYKGKYELNRDSAKQWIKDDLRGEYVNRDTGEKIEIRKDGAQKVTSHSMGNEAHLKSIAVIPELIEKSIFLDEIPNEKNNGKYDSYRYYVCGLRIGSEDYTVKITVGVKGASKYYDHALTQIEKGTLIDNIDALSTTFDNNMNTSSSVKDTKLLSILQTNSSKVVDENGEPLVVFHGTPLSRNQITPNRGWHGWDYVAQEAPFHIFKGGEYSGLIFTSVDAGKARSIAETRAMSIPDDEQGNEQWTEEGYVYDLYLNSKNPFDPKDENSVRRILQSIGNEIPTLSFYGGKGDNVSPEDALKMASSDRNSWLLTETPEFLSKVKEFGYDGLVGYDEGVKYVAAFSPNQLKDAYGNNGEFSTKNDDIRFSISKAAEAVTRAREEKVTTAVSNLSGSLNVPVRVVRNVDELPAGSEARSRIEQGRSIKGWFDPSTGEVVVYLPNAFDAADAVRTVLHEAVGHRGLRELLGAQEFDRAMTDIYRQLPQDIRSEIAGSAVKDYGANIAVATEEYLARRAEDNETPSWWERVVSAIRDLLRRAGINLELSGNDVKYLLWRSRKNLEQGDAVQYARDSVMRNRLDIDRGRKPLFRETAGKTVKKDKQADAAQVRSEYEKRMIASRFLLSEGYTDSMKALAEFHRLIEEETGKKIRDFENAYQAENALSSANLAQQEEFKRRHMDPIVQTLAAFVRHGVKAEIVSDWLITKHGIERNREMAMRKVIADAAAKNAARRLKVAVQMRVYTGEKPMTGQEKRRELARLEAEERDKLFDVWVETKRNVWNGGYSWTEQERILNTIAQDTFGADLTQDYSGLSSRYAGSEESTFTDEAMLFVEEFEKGRETLCSQMLERVAAATGRISDKQLDGGLMDIRTREHIRDMFRYYVPLRGWSEETAEDVYNYLKTDVPVFNAPLKKMEGRTSWPDDPLPTIANMAESGIAQANRNKMKQRFLMLVENHPTDLVSVSDVYVQLDNSTDEYTVIQPQIPRNATPEEAARYMDEFRKDMEEKANKEDSGVYRASELGDIPYRVPLTSELNEHIVVVKRGGREYMLTVNGNPRLAQAVNGLTNPDNEATGGLEQALNVARSITRFMSANFTTRNPEFVASNFMRDMLYANDMVHMKESPGYAARFHTNFLRFNPRTMAGLLKKFENDTLDMNDRTEKHFRDFMLNGGETGYTSLKEISRIKKEMAKDIRDVNKVTLRKGIRLLEKKLDLCNRSVEICARFTAFVTSRDTGRSVSRSIWDAKEITVNFNKKGSGGKMIDWKREVDGKLRDKLEWKGVKIALAGSSYFRAFYAFFNASMQGVVNMFRAARRHPGRFSAMMGGTFALGMLGAWMGYDDDESGYGYLPEWTRRNNICFSIGDVGIKIPLPHIFKTFYGLGELAMSVMLGKERGDGWDVVKKAGALLSQLLPIDMYGEGGLKTLVPTAATPPLEVSWNEDWTGSPIYRENSFNEDMPEWTKAYDSTATPYVVAAKYLNKWTSGDGDGEYDKGWANINPAAMEHIVNGYLGGVTTFASKLGNTIEMIWNEDKREVRNIPILNRFLWEAGPRQKEAAVKREYFENLKFMDDIRQKERGYLKKIKENGDMMEVARYQTLFHKLMHSDEYRKYLNMKEEKKVVDKLREAYGDDPTDEQNERLMLWMQRLNDVADEPYGEKEDAAKAVAR